MRNVNCEIFYGLSVLSVKTKKYILAKVQYSMWKYMGCLYCRWKLRLISWKQCFQQLFPWEHVCLLAFCNLHLYFYIILYLSTSWQYCFKQLLLKRTSGCLQRWANSVLRTEYEYEYCLSSKKWPNTNTNIIRFEKITRIRIRILFGLKISTEYEYEYFGIRILFE